MARQKASVYRVAIHSQLWYRALALNRHDELETKRYLENLIDRGLRIDEENQRGHRLEPDRFPRRN